METMEHVVCSFRLQELPVHVIASHIMPMVDIKELVALDSTGAMTIGGVLQEARDLMPPIKLPHNLSRSVGIWLLEHGYSLKDCKLPSLEIDGAAGLAAVMEQYAKQLHDVHLDLPNKSVESPALISRVSKLSISHSVTCKQVEELCMNTCNVVELSVSSVAETAHPELLSQLLLGVPKLKKLWCGSENLSTALPALSHVGSKLKELLLTVCTTDSIAELIGGASTLFPNLEHLHIADYRNTRLSTDVEPVLSKVTIFGFLLTTHGLRRWLCKSRGLRSIARSSEWPAEDILAVAECGARLEAVPLHHALLGNLATYTTLFAHLQNVQFGHAFLISSCAAAAVSCMLALDSVHFYYGHTPAPASVDINAVLRAMAVSCRQLRKVLCSGHYMTDSFASALAAVLTSNVHLERLDLSGNGSATAPMPKALADALVQCRSLQCLWWTATALTIARCCRLWPLCAG
jgi:hypothetical protein